ncbi:Aldo/keto reductase family [Aspergillus sp. HF37]|nr:Aldo/keto reductase family [Aspergillus sp. HF37]
MPPSIPLSSVFPPLILGGAGFSHQVFRNPNTTQALQVLKRAFEMGLRAIDTSSYYHPSEQLLGEALSHPDIASKYPRDQYFLMTKVGRIGTTQFNYSPAWVRQSVARSLRRLRTDYLDVVFCHDVEFVPEEEVLQAVEVLLDLVRDGRIRYIGVSGYRIDVLSRVALRVKERYGRPLDVVQNWAQLTLQNDRLARDGLAALQAAGVTCICSSSPLALGLLRTGGVPVGDLGDFHPAPPGLRHAAQKAADYVAARGESLADLALRYALRSAHQASTPDVRVSTIMGITSIPELEDNLATAQQVLRRCDKGHWHWSVDNPPTKEDKSESTDKPLCAAVQEILGPWRNYSFPIPGEGWDVTTKRPVQARL